VVAASAIAFPFAHRRAAAIPMRRLVIVMPLKNGGGADQENLALGLSATLADALWRMHAVQIAPVTSDTELARFASSAPVGTVVLGGVVTRSQDRVLANIWLDDVSTHRRLWSAPYERRVADITAMSNEVAAGIATELNSSLDAESPSKAVDP